MMRPAIRIVVVVAVAMLSGCATVAGGMIGGGIGLATGHPVSGAMIGTGVGILIDTSRSYDYEDERGR